MDLMGLFATIEKDFHVNSKAHGVIIFHMIT